MGYYFVFVHQVRVSQSLPWLTQLRRTNSQLTFKESQAMITLILWIKNVVLTKKCSYAYPNIYLNWLQKCWIPQTWKSRNAPITWWMMDDTPAPCVPKTPIWREPGSPLKFNLVGLGNLKCNSCETIHITSGKLWLKMRRMNVISPVLHIFVSSLRLKHRMSMIQRALDSPGLVDYFSYPHHG